MKVLLVEDNDVTRTALAVLLEQAGHQVAQAATAEQAQALLQPFAPDVAIVDHFLKGDTDGDGLLGMIRRRKDRLSTLPVVLQTAAGDETVSRLRRTADALGSARVLRKPCPPEDVITALREMGAATLEAR